MKCTEIKFRLTNGDRRGMSPGGESWQRTFHLRTHLSFVDLPRTMLGKIAFTTVHPNAVFGHRYPLFEAREIRAKCEFRVCESSARMRHISPAWLHQILCKQRSILVHWHSTAYNWAEGLAFCVLFLLTDSAQNGEFPVTGQTILVHGWEGVSTLAKSNACVLMSSCYLSHFLIFYTRRKLACIVNSAKVERELYWHAIWQWNTVGMVIKLSKNCGVFDLDQSTVIKSARYVSTRSLFELRAWFRIFSARIFLTQSCRRNLTLFGLRYHMLLIIFGVLYLSV